MVVEQVNSNTSTGIYLLTCIEDLVQDAGLYGSLWNIPFTDISMYIQSHSLIYHSFQYNTNNDIQISVEHGKHTTIMSKKNIILLGETFKTHLQSGKLPVISPSRKVDIPIYEWNNHWYYFLSIDRKFLFHRLGETNQHRHLQKERTFTPFLPHIWYATERGAK